MKRITAIILGTIVLIFGGVIGLLALTIINSKDCNQIVIDTNELHSGIDIPEVDYINI